MTEAEASSSPIRPAPNADPLGADAPRREEEFAELVANLHEAHEMIDAIRRGGVDSLMIGPPGEERVYDLSGKDSAYRLLVESMNQGAATVDDQGAILYANPRLATMMGRPMAELVGSTALDLTTDYSRDSFAHLLDVGSGDSVRGELELACADGATLPIAVDVSALDVDGAHLRFLVMSDRGARRPARRELAEPPEPVAPREANNARETMSERISDDAPTRLAHIDAGDERRSESELRPLPSDLEARVQPRTSDLRRGALETRETRDHILGPKGPQLSASQLHPWVWNAAVDLWSKGHYMQAVGEAAKRVELQTQNKLERHDVSGAPLFGDAFGDQQAAPGRPRLRFPDLEVGGERWTSAQVGAMHFGRGCMSGIRDWAAHDARTVDEQQALEYLAALSILARWVELADVEVA